MSMAICVFCSSQDSIAPKYFEVARELGAEIGRRGNTLVYGAGGAGLMGAVAGAAAPTEGACGRCRPGGAPPDRHHL